MGDQTEEETRLAQEAAQRSAAAETARQNAAQQEAIAKSLAAARLEQEAAAQRRKEESNAVWRNFLFLAGAVIIVVLLIAFVPQPNANDLNGKALLRAVEFLAVGALAGLVGYGELVSRYQDSPGRLLKSSPTCVYVLVNIAAGIAALWIVVTLDVFKDNAHPHLFEVLLASFGAVAFFRTSLFTARVGGTDIGIGPSALLQSILTATDRMIDRDQAQGRAVGVAEIMRTVDYAKARAALPVFCLILVQSGTAPDQTGLGSDIEKLDARKDIDDASKSIILGVYLIRVVGPDVLERSVRALGKQIQRD